MRSKATGPKTGFAGVLLVASFAILRASMAMFSAEIPRSRPFGGWESSVMVESQGNHEKPVRRGGAGPNQYERLSYYRASCRTIGEECDQEVIERRC